LIQTAAGEHGTFLEKASHNHLGRPVKQPADRSLLPSDPSEQSKPGEDRPATNPTKLPFAPFSFR
jgi:hypothetical protein